MPLPQVAGIDLALWSIDTGTRMCNMFAVKRDRWPCQPEAAVGVAEPQADSCHCRMGSLIQRPRHVVAQEYRTRLKGGETMPPLLDCRDRAGTSVEMVVKLAHPDPPGFTFGPLSLACELIGAILAQALGLSVPDYAIVEVDQEFANSVPDDARGLFLNNVGRHFGSKYHPGVGDFEPGKRVASPAALQHLEDILSFDAMTLNCDRTQLKPNLLEAGDDYYLIDHSTIMPVHIPLAGNHHLTRCQIHSHCLFGTLSGRHRQYVSLVSRWASSLTPSELDDLFSCVPSEWGTPAHHYWLMQCFLRHRQVDGRDVTELLREVVR